MSEQDKDKLADFDNLEVEPLSDQDLESVAGGLADCSCTNTTSACSAVAADQA